jgi:hypothetical protein
MKFSYYILVALFPKLVLTPLNNPSPFPYLPLLYELTDLKESYFSPVQF